MKKILTCIIILVLATRMVYSIDQPIKLGDPRGNQRKQVAAACHAPSAFTDVNIGNVRARINAGGDFWWDLLGNSKYTIPKNSNKSSLFSGALWIGGLDDDGHLKLAGQLYRQTGVDFFPGPLSADGYATVDAQTCDTWDTLFTVTRAEVEAFVAAYASDPALIGYTVPQCIRQYPAHGDVSLNQSYYLAPFYDNDQDGKYNYRNGDYPYYDLTNSLCINSFCNNSQVTMEGNGLMRDQALKGDQTIWWVFNDKGDLHGETQGDQIGLEIRGQAFAFATNDEINNMTFYSFEIINRSSERLNQTYTGVFVNCDLGYAGDDYVGSDVYRGLGYCYNGEDVDGLGQQEAYGANPPAVGIDFFQGPYLDPNGIDDPRYDGTGELICDVGINGSNFGDGCIDNERYGMGKFVYFNGFGSYDPMVYPSSAAHYYNYLRGIWRDNQPLIYWGNGHPNAGGYGPVCSFMYPGDSDPCHFGTYGIDPGAPYPAEYWTEPQAGNDPYDRRFIISVGPFTMEPGAVNYVSFGVPWARTLNGGPLASVNLLKLADDKAQALFDNCFRSVKEPDAPDLTIQELDRELILYISNRKGISNNFVERQEDYVEVDPTIIYADTVPASQRGDSAYRFEGYQVFQVSDASVTVDDIHDPDKARLVAQCDIRNGVTKLVNFYYDENLAGSVPVEEVNGTDGGIVHSFRIFEDAFASNDKRLINFKQYYFIAIAYAYNCYSRFDPMDPMTLNGQKHPYRASKKGALGAIVPQVGIPHIPSPETGGTITHSEYGVQPRITRLEGQGNGGLTLDLTQETQALILAQGSAGNLEYVYNKGPVNVKVVDPLNLPAADYSLRFVPPVSGNIDSCTWVLTNTETGQNWASDLSIKSGNEQLLMDIGLSVQINQVPLPGYDAAPVNGFLEATIGFADSTKQWFTGFPDFDGYAPFNWIRAGSGIDPNNNDNSDYEPGSESHPLWIDPHEAYEKVLSGTWAPFALVSHSADGPAPVINGIFMSRSAMMQQIASVDLFITADRSKWSRCPVFEECSNTTLSEGGVAKLDLRYGSTDGEQGMGWFPGYAVNVETGERLNVAFGEDTWIASQNGKDMIWNPTSEMVSGQGDVMFGGQHWIYIFGHYRDSVTSFYGRIDCPAYDGGAWIKSAMTNPSYHDRQKQFVFKDVMWVGSAATTFNGYWEPEQIPCDVKIRLRVGKPYRRFWSSKNFGPGAPVNNNYPLYTFSTKEIGVELQDQIAAEGSLALINVVPNPYFAYSAYENSELEKKVKITNLPEKCVITIYTVNGILVRQFNKDDATTYLDWDLNNSAGHPIAGGIYLIYIHADGIGDTVLKWFGAMRPSGVNPF